MDPVDRTVLLARAALSPSSLDDARARRVLGLRSASPLPAGPPQSLAGAGVWAALRATGGAGVALGALLMALGFAGGLWVGQREPLVGAVAPPPVLPPTPSRVAALEPPAPPATEPRESAALERDGHAPREGRAEPAREALAASPAPPQRTGSARRAHPLLGRSKALPRTASEGAMVDPGIGDPSEELALLRRIEKSLRSDEPALALALLGELTQRFPETRLDEERAAASVLVHCALHDPGARRRAEEFLSQRAASVYADRVRAGCSLGAAAGAAELEAAPAGARR
jgi:hypothetical protein